MRHIGSRFLAGTAMAVLMTIAAPAFFQDLETRIEAMEQELKLLREQMRNQVNAANDKAEAAMAKAESGPRLNSPLTKSALDVRCLI